MKKGRENPRDQYAVAVCMVGEIVRHIPKNILTKFITHGGVIYCKVTGGIFLKAGWNSLHATLHGKCNRTK